jgi:hypothetical protein
MEEKIINLKVSMDLLFAYSAGYNGFDQLLKNEGNDKYIISLIYSGKKKQNVDVFRVSEIKDPGLRERTHHLDQGTPLVNTCDNGAFVYCYLSDAKLLTENVGDLVREQLKKLVR